MALLQVNARAGGLEIPGGHIPGQAWEGELAAAVARLPEGAPIMVLIHGLRFSPFRPAIDPHRHILSLDPRQDCWKALSWPRNLGFTQTGRADGLCIAFGWEASSPSYALALRQVYPRAPDAAAALARLIDTLVRLAPARRVDLVAHSLGGRVALGAVARVTRPGIGRVILMGAAEYQSAATRALANPAAREAEFYNVTSAENALFDALFRRIVPAGTPDDMPLGAGLAQAPRRWVDIRIDCDRVLARLAARGVPIAPRGRAVCHWSFYLRPGIFGLYRAILRERTGWSAPLLNAALPAPEPAPALASLAGAMRWPVPALPPLRRPGRA